MPQLASHFEKVGISPVFFCSDWFSTLFSYTFEIELTARVWDIFFLEGMNIIFKLALAILKTSENDLMLLKFEDIIVYLKEKTSTINDVSIIEVADRFASFEETMEKIEEQLEEKYPNYTTIES